MACQTRKISFKKEDGLDFTTILKERVNNFFKEKGISPKANFWMWAKSIFLMGLAVVTYVVIMSNVVGVLGFFGLSVLLGFLISIGTMNIAHDALHGAYASKSYLNRILGLTMDLSGAISFYWKKEHTVDHHTFTNIAEHDSDLDVPIVLRLCPKAPHRWFHRFQHFYAVFLYSFNLMHWVYVSDLKRIFRVLKNREASPGKPSRGEVAIMISFKLLHILLFLGVPLLLISFPWWIIVLGYISFLATSGVTLTVIFQLAHIVENVAFPEPDEGGNLENSFIKHQLTTTSNFANGNPFVNFLFGGLNFQIEHHIFPHVCHMHLSKVSPIVKSTAQEFGVPYHENPSFFSAVRSHFRTLKKLGKTP